MIKRFFEEAMEGRVKNKFYLVEGGVNHFFTLLQGGINNFLTLFESQQLTPHLVSNLFVSNVIEFTLTF